MLGFGQNIYVSREIFKNDTPNLKSKTVKRDFFGKLNNIIREDKQKIDLKYRELKRKVKGGK